MKTIFVYIAIALLALSVHAQKVHIITVHQGDDIRKALRTAERYATDTLWTEIRLSPGVYWIDNPDDSTMRIPEEGESTPFGMKVKMSRTRIIGLSENPEDVVLAVNRGQTQGALGNYTMLLWDGTDVEVRNVTFGNYCNVDLDYPRNPKLSRKKRADAIVQAQLVICNGGRYKIDNCRFISRLNLCPFVGAEQVNFRDCYFECTDDALCGTGIYDHCQFTLYSSKPFYCTSPQGALLRDCDIHTKVHGVQYLTKVHDRIKLENCRWTSDDKNLRIEWSKQPDPRRECQMINCTLNGEPLNLPNASTYPVPVTLPGIEITNQTSIIPGKWTIDAYKPSDTAEYNWTAANDRAAWVYSSGIDGAEGHSGMMQNVRGARMMYCALPGNYADMTLNVDLAPCKSAGQGFGSATGQYMDVCIKFDPYTLTGYGMRFIRTPDYDRAVEVKLVEYQQGNIVPITSTELCNLYRAGLHLILTMRGNTLSAHLTNGDNQQTLNAQIPSVNSYGGIHIQHTGSTGASATVISNLQIEYK
ncbi:MAG: hypothetical protein MJZ41_05510 [Bacteroidaceae bacterium]|nr:hypothetical protein [Bacteroidaceae bacterium]